MPMNKRRLSKPDTVKLRRFKLKARMRDSEKEHMRGRRRREGSKGDEV